MNGQTVTRSLRAVDVNVNVKALRDAFGENPARLGIGRKYLLDLRAHLLDAFDRGALDFHPYRSFDSGQLHIQTIFNRHGPGVRETGKLKFLVHLLKQFFVGHARPPLLAGFEYDGGVIHVERSIIGGAVGAAHYAENRLNLGECANDAILLLQQRSGLSHANAGERGRHVQ